MRAKWSAPICKYWKISEQMMVKYCDAKEILLISGFSIKAEIRSNMPSTARKDRCQKRHEIFVKKD